LWTVSAAWRNVGTTFRALAFLGEWVAVVAGDGAVFPGFLAGFGQRYGLETAETDVTTLAPHDGAELPTLRAGCIDLEIETVAVGVAAGPLDRPDPEHTQRLVGMLLACSNPHASAQFAPHISPHILCGMSPDLARRCWTTRCGEVPENRAYLARYGFTSDINSADTPSANYPHKRFRCSFAA